MRLPSGKFHLLVDPKRDSDYVRTEVDLTVTPEKKEQSTELRMKRGCVVTLTVVDADTGMGIPSLKLYQEHSRYGWMQLDPSTVWGDSRFSTDAKGTIRAVVYPGKRKFTAGAAGPPDRIPNAPEGWEVIPDTDDPREVAPGIKELELPAGKTVTAQFKLRKVK